MWRTCDGRFELFGYAHAGLTTSLEVYVFAAIAPDGRFQRIEETTLMLKGTDADRNLGSAR